MDTDLAETEAALAPRVRVMQILAGALIFGVLTIGGVFLAIGSDADDLDPRGGVDAAGAEADVVGGELDADLDPGDPVLAYAGLAFGALALVSHLPVGAVVGGIAAGRAGGANGRADAVDAFQTRMIVRLAVLEGAAVINLVFWLIEGWWPTWLVVGVLLAAMLAQVPTTGKVRRYVEARDQLRALEPDRSA